MRQGKTVC